MWFELLEVIQVYFNTTTISSRGTTEYDYDVTEELYFSQEKDDRVSYSRQPFCCSTMGEYLRVKIGIYRGQCEKEQI